ncbi:MAG: PGPGW domain-containing protein [Terriglobia bacterium]
MARWVRPARIIGGFLLIGLGIIGLFLPFLQGIAMIAGGLLLLAPEFPWARRILDWMKGRWTAARTAGKTKS